MLFTAPHECAPRIRAIWDLIIGHFGSSSRARDWFVASGTQFGNRAPVDIWLTEGFAVFEALVQISIYAGGDL